MQELTYKFHFTVSTIPHKWDCKTQSDIFLSKGFIHVLENASPSNMGFVAISFFKEEVLVGKAVCQYLHLEAKEIFRTNKQKGVKRYVKEGIKSILKANVLVLGNMLHTGQHAFEFNDEIPFNVAQQNITRALKQLKKELSKKYGAIHLEVNKDFEPELKPKFEHINRVKKHHLFKVQPNMLLRIRENWDSFDDYLAAMTTKYRTRYKRARKKLNPEILVRELDLAAIKSFEREIFQLYKNVSDNAGFNTFILPQNHFTQLKENLGKDVKFTAYFLHNKLISFHTLITNNQEIEAYFLGYEPQVQHENQLYLNMLYDMVNTAIEKRFKTLVFARTAMEIKSSVGAEPVEMFGFIKHRHLLGNLILGKVFHLLQPQEEWQQRRPFKKGV